MLAAASGHVGCVDLLLSFNASPNASSDNGMTPIFFAIQNDHLACLSSLLNAGADPNTRDSKGKTPLYYAAQFDHVDCIELIENALKNIQIRDAQDIANFDPSSHKDCQECLANDPIKSKFVFKTGPTALMWAIKEGRTSCIQMLLHTGVDTNKRYEGQTALMEAVLKGRSEYAKILLASKADPNKKNSDGKTALILAAENGLKDCVSLLLASGANSKIKDEYENTALMCASERNHISCVKILIDNKEKFSPTDKEVNAALILSVQAGHPRIVRTLLNARANPNTKDWLGFTPLMHAVNLTYPSSLDCIQLLLNANANLDEKNEDGATALMHATSTGNLKSAKFLLDAGANPDLRNINGETALMIAIANKQSEAIKLLSDDSLKPITAVSRKSKTVKSMSKEPSSATCIADAHLPEEFIELRQLWEEIREKIKGHEDGEYISEEIDSAITASDFGFFPIIEKMAPSNINRLSHVLCGPIYTCIDYEWPIESGFPMVPLIQLDLDVCSKLGGMNLGSGLLQIFIGHGKERSDQALIRVIPKKAIDKKHLQPIPVFKSQIDTFFEIDWARLKFDPDNNQCQALQITGFEGPFFYMVWTDPLSDQLSVEEWKSMGVDSKKIDRFDALLEGLLSQNRKGSHLFGPFFPMFYNPSDRPPPLYCFADGSMPFGEDGSGQIFFELDDVDHPKFSVEWRFQ